MKSRHLSVFRCILTVSFFYLNACTTMSYSSLSDAISSDDNLRTLYNQRITEFNRDFYASAFEGNIAEWHNAETIKFADQTVYFGFYMSWLGLRLFVDYDNALALANQAMNHMLNDLVVTSTLPSGQTSTGYFNRDNAAFNPVEVNNKSWQVQSDALSGTNNDMSQDQLIHVLFGYSVFTQAAKSLPPDANLTALIQKIADHADNIATRLNAYNYMIVTPSGQPAARGNDARAFAWPIAATASQITGKPISSFLQKITVLDERNRSISLSAAEMKELFTTALYGLTTGICDIKIGKEKQELCNRFALAMVNALYFSSGVFSEVKVYLERMEDDGDYFRSLFVRSALKSWRVPKAAEEALEDAIDSTFTSQVTGNLWCEDNRWIRLPLPGSCDSPSADLQFYNALDFMCFYAQLDNNAVRKMFP